MRVNLDFDGTIVEFMWPDIGPLLPHCKEVLERLHGKGVEFSVSTCRNRANVFEPGRDPLFLENDTRLHGRDTFLEMKTFLEEHFPFIVIDDGRSGKAYADVYLDDRALWWEPDWLKIGELIEMRLEGQTVNVLRQADLLVHGSRRKDYGHPLDICSRAGRMMGAVLGVPDIPAEKVAECLIALKLAREAGIPKLDSRIDVAGYAQVLQMIIEERARREG